ncbi:MAG: flagellar export chaperone FliS [Cellulosilyticaceae bacterium]
MATNPYQVYQNNSIMTASGPELTLMLYNGAIKFCNQAKEAIEIKNLQKAHENIIKTENIIEELRITLKKDLPIAKDMDNMYMFINDLLVKANMKKDVNMLEDATFLIKEFRDAWKEAMGKGKKI